MRWRHRELGEIGPSRFIALAEELHLIDQLGKLALETAIDDIGSMDGLLERHPAFRVGVNLSCRQFVGLDLVDTITDILLRREFPPENLRLEITESVVFEHQERAVDMLHQLRHFGIEIDIDDFGTGYSNLSYLMRLPVSSLKIDQSFVRAIGDDGGNTEIIETIISMARSLDLSVVAEGVETKGQLAALKRLGCERAQGFLLARPMSREKLAQFMLDNERYMLPEKIFDVATVSTIQ
jgi:EAL domain-containing protein (putative c-di-GMP-specific phosphodiesterase class I)